MRSFTFQAPPNILFEVGASKKLAELVAGYGAKRVLLVTDKGVTQCRDYQKRRGGPDRGRMRAHGI
jgi:alcohol dehydrogenase class IV